MVILFYLDILENDMWLEYSIKILTETIKKDRQILGGVKPPSNMLNPSGEAAVMAQGTSTIISADSGYMLDPFNHKTADDILHKSSGKLSSLEQLNKSEESLTPEHHHSSERRDTRSGSEDKRVEPSKNPPPSAPSDSWKYSNVEDPFEMATPGQWIGQEAAHEFIKTLGQQLPIQFVSPSIAAIDGSGLSFAKDIGKQTEIDPFDIPDPFNIPVKEEHLVPTEKTVEISLNVDSLKISAPEEVLKVKTEPNTDKPIDVIKEAHNEKEVSNLVQTEESSEVKSEVAPNSVESSNIPAETK
eukprot:NODE_60_length_27201_cov_1.043318.p16 type:complete len:300 gc:universal NODE_60_length_27201_cov_1.043318:5510-6409(+)